MSKVNRGRQKQSRARARGQWREAMNVHEQQNLEAQERARVQMEAECVRISAEVEAMRESNKARVAALLRLGIQVMPQGVDVRALVKLVSGNNPAFMAAWELQIEHDMAEMLVEAESDETMAKVREMQLVQGVGAVPGIGAGVGAGASEEAVVREIAGKHGGVVLGG